MTIQEVIDFLPSAPAFDPLAVWDPTPEFRAPPPSKPDIQRVWVSLRGLEYQLGMSDSGIAKIRKYLHHSYEHRDAQGRVYVYGPYWWRAYRAYMQSR